MTLSALMPAKRSGQDVLRFYLDEELKQKFRRICAIKGTNMTSEVIRLITETVAANEHLIDFVDAKLHENKE